MFLSHGTCEDGGQELTKSGEGAAQEGEYKIRKLVQVDGHQGYDCGATLLQEASTVVLTSRLENIP